MSTSQTSTQNGAVKGDKAARRQRFEDVFPVIAKELSDHLKGEGMPKDAVEWYERVRRARRAWGTLADGRTWTTTPRAVRCLSLRGVSLTCRQAQPRNVRR